MTLVMIKSEQLNSNGTAFFTQTMSIQNDEWTNNFGPSLRNFISKNNNKEGFKELRLLRLVNAKMKTAAFSQFLVFKMIEIKMREFDSKEKHIFKGCFQS